MYNRRKLCKKRNYKKYNRKKGINCITQVIKANSKIQSERYFTRIKNKMHRIKSITKK